MTTAAHAAEVARRPADERELLRAEIVARAVKLGDGIDHRGRSMPWILDMREVLLTHPGLELAAALLWSRLRIVRPDAVAGVGVSGAPLVAGLVLAAGRDGVRLDGLVVRDRPKGYGRARAVEGPPVRRGARAVVVDDVVNSGATVEAAVRALRAAGAAAIGVAAVVDLQSPRARDVLDRYGLTLRSLFTATNLGIGVRLPSHRRTAREARIGVAARPAESPSVHRVEARVCDDGSVSGVDRSSGETLWRLVAGRGPSAGTAFCGSMLVVATPHRFVLGVEPASGTLRWIANLGAVGPSAPCAVDERTVAAVVGGDVCLLDAADGELLWWRGGHGAGAVTSRCDGTFTVLDVAGPVEYVLADA